MPPMTTEKLKSNEPEMYTQCVLVKGNLRQTSWIPAKFAVPKRVLKLKDERGQWDDGWQVATCYATWPGWKIDSLRQARKRLGSIEEGLS